MPQPHVAAPRQSPPPVSQPAGRHICDADAAPSVETAQRRPGPAGSPAPIATAPGPAVDHQPSRQTVAADRAAPAIEPASTVAQSSNHLTNYRSRSRAILRAASQAVASGGPKTRRPQGHTPKDGRTFNRGSEPFSEPHAGGDSRRTRRPTDPRGSRRTDVCSDVSDNRDFQTSGVLPLFLWARGRFGRFGQSFSLS